MGTSDKVNDAIAQQEELDKLGLILTDFDLGSLKDGLPPGLLGPLHPTEYGKEWEGIPQSSTLFAQTEASLKGIGPEPIGNAFENAVSDPAQPQDTFGFSLSLKW